MNSWYTKNTMILQPLLLLLLLTPAVTEAGFSDVSVHHTNTAAIEYVQEQGIVRGYPDGTFGPSRSINRAEFTKIIIESLYDSPSGTNCFPDVGTEWFAEYVCYAKTLGIIGGYPDGTFQPGRPVQFAEAAKIIANGFSLQGESGPEWFAEFVSGLEGKSAIPTSINSFSQELTRADMAEIIYRLDAQITSKPSKTYVQLGGAAKAKAKAKAVVAGGYPYTFTMDENWKNSWNFYVDKNAPPIDPEKGINHLVDLDLERVDLVEEPEGRFKKFLRIHYPKGAGSFFVAHFYDKARAGVVAVALGGMKPTETIRMKYSVRFPEDFDFRTRGSLPGVGGAITTSNYGALGGTFGVGGGWTEKGKLRLTREFDDEMSITRITTATLEADNEWHTIEFVARLNTVPVRRLNGALDVFYDGERVYHNTGVKFRSRDGDMFDSLDFISTIGGYDTFSVAPHDMYVDIANIVVSE